MNQHTPHSQKKASDTKLSQRREVKITCILGCQKEYFRKQAYIQHLKLKHKDQNMRELYINSKMPQDILEQLLKQIRHKDVPVHQKECSLLIFSQKICTQISNKYGKECMLTEDQKNQDDDFDMIKEHFQQQKINEQVERMLEIKQLTQILKPQSYAQMFKEICYNQSRSNRFEFHICHDISKEFKFKYAWRIELAITLLVLQKFVDQELNKIIENIIVNYQAQGHIFMVLTLSKYVQNFIAARQQLEK